MRISINYDGPLFEKFSSFVAASPLVGKNVCIAMNNLRRTT